MWALSYTGGFGKVDKSVWNLLEERGKGDLQTQTRRVCLLRTTEHDLVPVLHGTSARDWPAHCPGKVPRIEEAGLGEQRHRACKSGDTVCGPSLCLGRSDLLPSAEHSLGQVPSPGGGPALGLGRWETSSSGDGALVMPEGFADRGGLTVVI